MGWFPAELYDEVRAARQADTAKTAVRAQRSRRAPSGMELRAQRMAAAMTARVGRVFTMTAWALQVVVLVWLGATFSAGAVLVGLVILGVLAALRTVAANCMARRWPHWAGAAVAAIVVGIVAVGVWLGVVQQRPALAAVFVVGQLVAVVGFAVMAVARTQGGRSIVVV